ncbi:hypothetical protein, partial [Nonomuraea sp. NPDC050405]
MTSAHPGLPRVSRLTAAGLVTGGLVGAAEAAVLRSVVDPRQAMLAAQAVLSAAEARGVAEAAVVALRAMGLAARELGDLEAA